MIFGFLPQNLKIKAAVAVAFSIAWRGSEVEAGAGGAVRARGRLAAFRSGLYRCLTARGDALFGLADAVLCGDGPVRVLAGLSLVPGHQRGHGAVYDALSAGRVDVPQLRWAVGAVPLPAWPDGRIRLAVDVCNWLRPEARTSPERMFCHVHGRGKNAGQMIPGWPYSFVAALGPGASSWTAPLDVARIGPDDDDTEVTAAQLREVAGRLAAAGHRWTWIIIAAYTQLRLARALAADLRLPWQRPQPPGAMTPARVRRGFRAVREALGTPAAPPRPSRPGPGRPEGSKNKRKAPRHHVGKRNLKRANRAKRKARAKPPP